MNWFTADHDGRWQEGEIVTERISIWIQREIDFGEKSEQEQTQVNLLSILFDIIKDNSTVIF